MNRFCLIWSAEWSMMLVRAIYAKRNLKQDGIIINNLSKIENWKMQLNSPNIFGSVKIKAKFWK